MFPINILNFILCEVKERMDKEKDGDPKKAFNLVVFFSE